MCRAGTIDLLVYPGWHVPQSLLATCGATGGRPWHASQEADRNVAVTATGAVRFASVQTLVVEAQPVQPTSSNPGAAVAVSAMLPPDVTAAEQSSGQLIASTTAPPSGAVIVPVPETCA